uniref:Uncharacterized protein n=1 Tax=Cacopsylla melanoneura TaxID=428564 RepID=A0A8D9FGT3_9HEMI
MLSPIPIETKDVSTTTGTTKLNVEEVYSDTSDEASSLPTDSTDYVPEIQSETSESIEGKQCYGETRKKLLSNTMLFLGVPGNSVFIIDLLVKHIKTQERNILMCLKKK